MRNFKKILHITNMQNRNWKSALYNYLLTYRVAPNMSTKVLPAFLLNNKMLRRKIPTISHEIDNKVHQKLEPYNKIMKDKMKKYFDNRYHKKQSNAYRKLCFSETTKNKLKPQFDPDHYFIKCVKGSLVTAERRNKSTNKEHFIFLPINNKNNLNYRNVTNNNENDDDFDIDLVKTSTENESNPSPPIRRYPVRARNRPMFYHELQGWR